MCFYVIFIEDLKVLLDYFASAGVCTHVEIDDGGTADPSLLVPKDWTIGNHDFFLPVLVGTAKGEDAIFCPKRSTNPKRWDGLAEILRSIGSLRSSGAISSLGVAFTDMCKDAGKKESTLPKLLPVAWLRLFIIYIGMFFFVF